MPYAEIVATVASALGRPRHPPRTSTSSPAPRRQAWRSLGGAGRGKAIIILNPAEPPLIMRDTIFCAVPDDADQQAVDRLDPRRWPRWRQYVPGYRLRQRPAVRLGAEPPAAA